MDKDKWEKYVKKTKRFSNNRRLIDCEMFVSPHSHSINILLFLSHFVFLTSFFSHVLILLFPFFLHTYLIALFIYLPHIHHDEGLHSETSVIYTTQLST